MRKWVISLCAVMLLTVLPARAERIKDIVSIKGIRGNPLLGPGLVVGLSGTGGDSAIARRMLANILRSGGTTLNPEDITSKNIAAVLVTADLPPFARKGRRIDVTVSVADNSTGLRGGKLIMVPLKGADGLTYAIAQGSVSVGGFAASGQSASIIKNHPTVGRIPGGATVEKEELSDLADFVENGQIMLQLLNPDFTTAERIAEAVNAVFPKSSHAVDAGTVQIEVPKTLTRGKIVGFICDIHKLQVEVDIAAVVVINERTGTIIVGQNVSISMVAIAHGNLTIITQEKDIVSQPPPLSRGGTSEKVHRTAIEVREGKGILHVVPRQVSVAELARALNAMGLTPGDLIAIFEALAEAGALQAKLKVM